MGHEIENCLKLAGFWNNLIDILERNELSVGYWRLNYISSLCPLKWREVVLRLEGENIMLRRATIK
jgi:hypothetical protein